MPDLEVVGHIFYGKINHYSAQGQLNKTTKLSLGEDAVDFTPLLYTHAIIPNLSTIYKIQE